MNYIKVGTYSLGPDAVALYLRPDLGAEFYFNHEVGAVPKIVVGGGTGQWSRVVEYLHHEAMEMAMAKTGCRFAPSPDYGQDHGGYIFSMTHAQFSECSARAGHFMAAAMPDLQRVWRKYKHKLQ